MPEIENIKNAIRELAQILINRTEPLSEGEKKQLAQVLEHAAIRISELRQQEEPLQKEEEEVAKEVAATGETQQENPPQGPLPSIPQLEEAPHPSSNINAFRYEPESKRLFIKFQDKYPGQNGPVYSYEGVPKNIFDVFSRGAVAPKTSGKNAWHRWRKGVAPSHGAAMYALIREGGFPYQRLS